MWWMYVYLLQHFTTFFLHARITFFITPFLHTIIDHALLHCSRSFSTFPFYCHAATRCSHPTSPSPFASHSLICSPPYTASLRHTSPSGIVTESESNYTAFILLSLSLIVCCWCRVKMLMRYWRGSRIKITVYCTFLYRSPFFAIELSGS